MHEQWQRGGKYYETWKSYTVAACGRGKDDQGNQLWHFTAYHGKKDFLGVFDKASQARNHCEEHFSANNNDALKSSQ